MRRWLSERRLAPDRARGGWRGRCVRRPDAARVVSRTIFRVAPVGFGDEVELAPVDPCRDDLGSQPPRLEGAQRGPGRSVERLVLGGCGDPSVEEPRTVFVDQEDLRAPIEGEQQRPRPGRTRAQLAVHVAEVRAAHDRDMHAVRTKLFDHGTQRGRVTVAIGHRSPIPVEHERLEAPAQRGGQRVHNAPAAVRCQGATSGSRAPDSPAGRQEQ
jgi:hypothetical protein